jgi:hypothetical protein
MGKMRNGHKILIGKPGRKRSRGRPRREWEDIRINHRVLGLEGVGWIHLAQDRDQCWAPVNTVGPSGYIKGGEFLE